MLDLNKDATSLDVPWAQETDQTIADMIPDENNIDPVVLLQNADVEVLVESWLDELSEKQREILSRRFGLRGHERATLEEVGKTVGLTRERVRQIQLEALHKLRNLLVERGFSDDLIG